MRLFTTVFLIGKSQMILLNVIKPNSKRLSKKKNRLSALYVSVNIKVTCRARIQIFPNTRAKQSRKSWWGKREKRANFRVKGTQ